MNHAPLILIFALFLTIPRAFSFQLPTLTHGKIIGNLPQIPVRADGSNIDRALLPALDAIGLISISTAGGCTGTHIGSGLVLTAGHCFLNGARETSTLQQKAVLLQNQPCSGISVSWGYRGSPETGSPRPIITLLSQCTQILFLERNANTDFALFRVNTAPDAKIALAFESSRTSNNTKLTLLGYPNLNPLEWSQYCPLINLAHSSEMAKFYGSGRLLYQCDTQRGNSGSALLALSAKGALEIVGLHNDAAPTGIPYNIGSYIFDIENELMSHGIDLSKIGR